jgi:hypothetical protein
MMERKGKEYNQVSIFNRLSSGGKNLFAFSYRLVLNKNNARRKREDDIFVFYLESVDYSEYSSRDSVLQYSEYFV